jgi:hypothetical protein
VCALICVTPRASLRRPWRPPTVLPSVPVFPRTEPGSSDVAEPRIRANVPLSLRHDSPWDVSPCRQPLSSPARLSHAAVPFRPASNTCCAPKNPRGFCCTHRTTRSRGRSQSTGSGAADLFRLRHTACRPDPRRAGSAQIPCGRPLESSHAFAHTTTCRRRSWRDPLHRATPATT